MSNYYPSLNELVSITGTPNPTLVSAYPIVAGNTVNINSGNYVTFQNLNFAPRLGFAYRLTKNGDLVVRGGYGLYYDYFPSIINGLAGNPPYQATVSYAVSNNVTPSLTFDNAFPSSTATLPTNINIAGVEQHPKTPYNEQWNLTVEKQLGANTSFRVTYAGNQGHHLYIPFNYNDPQPQPIPAGSSLQALRPHQPWGAISLSEFRTDTNLNQLQVEARRRFSGLSFDFQYQYSRALGIDGANDGAPTNNLNISRDYGNLDFYARHFAKLSHTYDLPFGRGKYLLGNANGMVDRLAGGWRLTGILSANTGQPYSVSFNSTLAGWPSGRASVVPGVSTKPSVQNYHQWINKAAFVAPAPYTYGNSPRNMLFGPNFVTYDMGIFKETRLAEKLTLELRAEAFNVLNRTNFNNPDSNINDANFGQITSAQTPGQIQFGSRLSF